MVRVHSREQAYIAWICCRGPGVGGCQTAAPIGGSSVCFAVAAFTEGDARASSEAARNTPVRILVNAGGADLPSVR
jgi:hypothetical protein